MHYHLKKSTYYYRPENNAPSFRLHHCCRLCSALFFYSFCVFYFSSAYHLYQSYAKVDLDNLGQLTLRSKIHGVNTQKNSKREIVLNYQHQENVFQLWRSLRFGDNLQTWFEQHAAIPGLRSSTGKESEE